MVEKVAMELVAALRSGKYPQGSARLRNSKGEFCCLGVLCDISNVGEWKVTDNFHEYTCAGKDGKKTSIESACLPQEVVAYAGLRNPWGDYNVPGPHGALTRDNDLGVSFEQIAEFIEKNWMHL